MKVFEVILYFFNFSESKILPGYHYKMFIFSYLSAYNDDLSAFSDDLKYLKFLLQNGNHVIKVSC